MDIRNSKIVDFSSKYAPKNDFQSNQMSATIMKGTKVKRIVLGRDREGERESLLDTALVMHCFSMARTTILLIFLVKMHQKTIFQPNQMSETILKGFKGRGRIPGRDREGKIESLLGNTVLMR